MNLSPMPITIWGPLEPPRKQGAGWRHILLGFVGMIVLSVLYALAIANLVVITSDWNPELSNMLRYWGTQTGPNMVTGLILLWSAWLLAIWLGGRATEGGFRTLVGWRFKPRRDLTVGLGIGLGVQTLTILVGYIFTLLSPNAAGQDLGNTDMVTSITGPWLPLVTVGATIGAPIVEELFFRGLVLNVAARQWGIHVGVVVQAAIFGVMHVQGSFTSSIYTVSVITIVGIVLGYLKIRTGRIGATIAAHIALNVCGVAAAYILGGLQ